MTQSSTCKRPLLSYFLAGVAEGEEVVGRRQVGVVGHLARINEVEVLSQEVAHGGGLEGGDLGEGERVGLEEVLEPEAIPSAGTLVLVGDDGDEGVAEGGTVYMRFHHQPDDAVDVVDLRVDALEVGSESGVVRHKVGEA